MKIKYKIIYNNNKWIRIVNWMILWIIILMVIVIVNHVKSLIELQLVLKDWLKRSKLINIFSNQKITLK